MYTRIPQSMGGGLLQSSCLAGKLGNKGYSWNTLTKIARFKWKPEKGQTLKSPVFELYVATVRKAKRTAAVSGGDANEKVMQQPGKTTREPAGRVGETSLEGFCGRRIQGEGKKEVAWRAT